MSATMWDSIQGFAAQGIEAFWLPNNSKKATLTGWPGKATHDVSALAKWFAPGSPHANGNWAVKAGTERKNTQTGETESLVILDLDRKNGKDGLRSLKEACQRAGLNLDDFDTLAIETPSGGFHFYFWSTQSIAQGVDVLGEHSGVDVRAGNGYVVGAGSTIDGKPYTVANEAPIASMGRLASLFRPASVTKKADTKPLDGIDSERAKARGIEYLNTAPRSIKGSGGDQCAYKVSAKLKDLGCTESQALDLMLSEHWNNGCGWTAERLAEKVAHAFKYGQEQPGNLAAEAVFTEAPSDGGADPAVHPLEALNREHAFVLRGSKDAILWETRDAEGRPTIEFLTVEAFHRKHAAKMFQSGNRSEPLTQAWMASPKRRSYDAAVFKPGKTLDSRFFNLWKGFAVQPAAGDWSLMRRHIREVICSDDPLLDRYVMGWLARMVHQPGTRGEVAMILRGGKGTGKGTLGHYLMRIFGNHGLYVSNAEHLVGRFNGHLQTAVFLFADEAFYAGNPKHEPILKSLVTEPQIMIEGKFRDAINSDNYLHLLLASNAEFVVPASADERRFCVLDVSDCRQQQNKAWFGPLHQQMDRGGLSAMLYDLLALDIRDFDVFDFPKTKALGDQKMHSLKGPDRWLHEVLSEGSIGGLFAWQDGACLAVEKTTAYAHYADRSRKIYGEHHPAAVDFFWKAIRKAVPLRDERSGTPRVRKAVFPQLPLARRAFAAHLKASVDWGDESEPSIFD